MESVDQIIASAADAGIELDAEDAGAWLAAAKARGGDGQVQLDTRAGVFGHRIAMLDFDPARLAHFRWIGSIVEIPDDDRVDTALALSGSAAQSKIQTYPGDCDFFERVNIRADTLSEACELFSDVLRDKVRQSARGDGYRLMEVKFGEYERDVVRSGRTHRAGASISWDASEALVGQIRAEGPSGEPISISWEEAARHPGWCKIDWIVADHAGGRLVNASNMIDATWEAPDGSITALDGYLDPYFQEVYLDVDSIPTFAKVTAHVDADALDAYVEALEKEVAKYLIGGHANVGKAAKRMYNVFRLNGSYEEAAFIRELFDEPANVLYQIYAVVRAVDEALQSDTGFPGDVIEAQMTSAIQQAIDVLDDVEEREVVRSLRHLDDDLHATRLDPIEVERARATLLNVVNNFFYDKLTTVPAIKTYMERCSAP